MINSPRIFLKLYQYSVRLHLCAANGQKAYHTINNKGRKMGRGEGHGIYSGGRRGTRYASNNEERK